MLWRQDTELSRRAKLISSSSTKLWGTTELGTIFKSVFYNSLSILKSEWKIWDRAKSVEFILNQAFDLGRKRPDEWVAQ